MDKNLRTSLTTLPAFLIVLGVLFFMPHLASAAEGPSLQFSPTSISGGIGERVSVSIVIDTDGRNVDGVTADFTYPASMLKVVNVSTPLSTFTNTAEENMSTPGVGKISRFLVGEYYNGVGEVAIVTFEFLSNGNAYLDFADNAMITFSGENILASTSGSSVLGAGTYVPENTSDDAEIPVQQRSPFSLWDPLTWSPLDFLVLLFIVFGISVFAYAIYKKRVEVHR